MVSSTRPVSSFPRSGRLGLVYKAAIVIYMLAVIILSYRDGLTFFAKAAALGLGVLFIFRAFAAGERVFFPVEYRLLLGWVMLAVISSALSSSPETALRRVMTLVQVYPIAFILSNMVVWNGDARFYWVSLIGAAVLSGIVTLANDRQFSDLDGRIFGTLDNANAFAALLAVGTGLVLAICIGTRSLLVRLLCIGIAGFFIYLVLRTGSRMGLLASFAAVVVVGWCYQSSGKSRFFKKTAVLVLVGSAVIGGGLFVLTSTEYAKRYAALQESLETGDFQSSGDMSLYGRARLYQKGFEIFLENPLLGVGLDVFRTAQLEFRTIGNNSHSNYVEILAGTGIAGAGLYFAMYYFWWGRLWRSRGALRDPQLLAAITSGATVAVVILVCDVAWVSYYEKLIWLVLAGLIAQTSLVAARSGQRPIGGR
ncbi:MAG: O-antigen ligase family protein [Gammaproteobacteria bacterium]|nr:O-antigen ligase family protein [Gammaproteobacteria bacterium]